LKQFMKTKDLSNVTNAMRLLKEKTIWLDTLILNMLTKETNDLVRMIIAYNRSQTEIN
jgi:ATP sulfurylase